MSIRVTYEHELQELNKDLKEMAHMVVAAIEQTFIAFEDQNFTLAEEIIKGDRRSMIWSGPLNPAAFL